MVLISNSRMNYYTLCLILMFGSVSFAQDNGENTSIDHIGYKELCSEFEEFSCYNGGECVNTNGTLSCDCKLGYQGEHCDQVDSETDVEGNVLDSRKPQISYYTHTVCEGEKFFIQCPLGTEIEIIDALFGRNDSTTCVHSYEDLFAESHVCATAGTKTVLNELCDGETRCHGLAVTSVLDPDRNSDCDTNIARKLSFSYHCKQKVYNVISCDGDGKIMIGCPNGQHITSKSAFYGRLESETCSDDTSVDFTACGTMSANQTFRNLCDGKDKCVIEASAETFGNPCPGVSKYMKLEYMCSDCANVHHSDEECEYWANQGSCNGTQGEWMLKNCFKACTVCEVAEGDCENVYNDEDCRDWEAEDQCVINPEWMYPNCRKTCLKCDRGTSCRNDAEIPCEYYASLGDDSLCSTNTTFMFEHCRGACFRCSDNDRGIHYENTYGDDEQCQIWAMVGECHNNPGFMLTRCWKACTGLSGPTHCINLEGDDKCDEWRGEDALEDGECAKNPSWMYRNCWKSCTNCQPKDPKCENIWEDEAECLYWRHIGECSRKESKAFMLQNCYKACSGCRSVPEVNECKNLYSGGDSVCDNWARSGECYKNQAWMNFYCKKSCSNCHSEYTGGLDFTGDALLPGDRFEFGKGKTILLPSTFYFTGKLKYFTAMFADKNPVTLQIRRKNVNTGEWEIRFQYTIDPEHVNTVEIIRIPESRCVNVRQGDRIGFNSRYDTSPIAYRIRDDDGESEILMRDTNSGGSFTKMLRPYQFSINAVYDPIEVCDNDEMDRMTHITDIAWIDMWIGEEHMGNITIGLFGEIAPITVENLVHLMQGTMADQNGFAGAIWHRVIHNFMMQGGDYMTSAGYGRHCSKWGEDFDDENFDLKHRCGRISMANSGSNTNGCQWVIQFRENAEWLDGHHVIFGIVLDGFEIARAVENNPTDADDRPIKQVQMKYTGIRKNPAPYPFWDLDTPVADCPY